MLLAADKPLIVAGGGIINADASDLLVEFAELVGVPVIPTLMGWGTIPDDHPLMAGMCGLQTSHRYGNATMLASDFVLGIGNRWANRHTGSTEVYCKGRKFVHVDIEPTQIGRVFAPDYGIVSDAKAALALFVEVARERSAAGKLRDYGDWAARCAERKRLMLRKTHYEETPIKPLRVYEEMNKAFGRDTVYVSTIGLSQIAGRAVPARLRPAPVDQLRPGRPAGLDDSRRARRRGRRPDAHRGRPVGRLRLPVPDRGARGRRAVPPAVRARARQQLLPRPDPPVAARLRDGLLRAAVLREPEHARERGRSARLRRGPRQPWPRAWAARRCA